MIRFDLSPYRILIDLKDKQMYEKKNYGTTLIPLDNTVLQSLPPSLQERGPPSSS